MTKKYKYIGNSPEIEIPYFGVVQYGEVIEVSFEIHNPDFEEITKEKKEK